MGFRPLHDRIVVKRSEEVESQTAGGIYIPDQSAEKPLHGEVLAVGDGKRNDNGDITPVCVKVGDKVVFAKYGGVEMKIDGEDVLILTESDILGVFE